VGRFVRQNRAQLIVVQLDAIPAGGTNTGGLPLRQVHPSEDSASLTPPQAAQRVHLAFGKLRSQ
jgi:hypothetical protein